MVLLVIFREVTAKMDDDLFNFIQVMMCLLLYRGIHKLLRWQSILQWSNIGVCASIFMYNNVVVICCNDKANAWARVRAAEPSVYHVISSWCRLLMSCCNLFLFVPLARPGIV